MELENEWGYKKYPKTQRFEKLTYTLSEKVDGTQATIVIPTNPECSLQAFSKNGPISVNKDNMGFAKFVLENEVELRKLGPGVHSGEFYGHKINRNYGLKTNKFMLFNAARYEKARMLQDAGYHCFPTCVEVETIIEDNITVHNISNRIAIRHFELLEYGSFHVRGFMRVEGMIIRDSMGRVFKHIIDK